MKIKEKVLKEVLKGGQCPDCSEKVDKCDCSFKELYVTLKIKKVEKAIDLTLAEVSKMIDEFMEDKGYMDFSRSSKGNIFRIWTRETQEELKKEIGI